MDQGVDRPAARARREGGRPRRRSSTRRCSTTATTCSQRVAAVGTDELEPRRRTSPTSPSATRPPTKASAEIAASSSPATFEGREREIKEAVRSPHEEARASRASSRRASASTAVVRPTSARCHAEVGIVPTGARLRPVPAGRDPGAQRLHARHAADGPAARHDRARRPTSATCTTTTCRRHANGETGRVGCPKRREIGHGLLAERALLPVVPSQEEFAYTLRLVSEVLASNGSTSMASVCASTLSLMDAGVPIKAPVAGIAMGLVFAEGKYTTLTDILGAEDAFGDMDFKVAGTADFVTALQLDTKIDGLPADVLAAALQQASDARLQILEVMHDGHRRAPRRGRRDRAEDHQLRDPDGQDRRGDRAEGQGHQRHPAGDRRRHRRRRRRHGRHGHHRLGRRRRGRRGRAADRAHPQPADAPIGRRDLHRPGREHHQVRCVREHPPGPRRPGAHLQARARQAHRPGRGRARLGDEIEVRVDDIDPNGKVSLTPIVEATRVRRRARATAMARATARTALRRELLVGERPALRCRSRMRSTPRPASSSATSVPLRRLPLRAAAQRQRPEWRPWSRAASQRRWRRRPPSLSGHASSAPSWLRASRRHRAHARSPLGVRRRVGRRRRA